MPRYKTTWKRKFRGNKHTGRSVNSPSSSSNNDNPSVEVRTPEHCPGLTEAEPRPSSSSKKKLAYMPGFVQAVSDENTSRNIIVDIDILSKLVCSFAACKFCGKEDSIIVSEGARKGLASQIMISCVNCDKNNAAMSSKLTRHRLYEINSRFAYGLRSIGKGETAGRTLCAVMNLPPFNARFAKHNEVIENAVTVVADLSMREAAREAVNENNGNTDIAAAFDGTWQRRGHSSLNGVITATSFDTGKVLDMECVTKYCQKCAQNRTQCQEGCLKNYSGSSGGMEGVGVVNIFARSIETRGVRYVKYLGDGDSNSYGSICAKKPYGEVAIEKLECIGHIQKRLGSRLRRLKNKMKGVKLDDGKVLGGKGRLTDEAIDKLQNYYGLAIRRNVNDVNKMHKQVWAIYFHKLSTNTNPQHALCPKGVDSWCGFQKTDAVSDSPQETYSHKNSLPEVVMTTIKPIFKDLSDKSLLSKCTHGKTQNPNESLNNVIWARVPKTNFVGYRTLKIGVLDAVITFNDGSMGRAKVLKEMGITPGFNAIAGFHRADIFRVKKAEKAILELTKEARQKRRSMKRKREDKEAENKQEYGAGDF